MKVKRISTEQFAGLQDTDIKFSDGLNIIVGENESGKSTIADLMFRTLFEDAKVGARSVINKTYFTKNANGRQADFAEGTIEFETEQGKYRLKKEWEKSGTSTLTLPDGTRIRNQDDINEELHEVLKYQDGVYKEIVFASQRLGHAAAKSIVEELSKDNKREGLLSTLTQTAMETGGVSIDKIEKELQDKLDMLGFRWDIDADLPEQGVKRGIQNQWKIKEDNNGILKAYYSMKTVEENMENTRKAELRVEQVHNELHRLEEDKKRAEGKYQEFLKYKGILNNRLLLEERIDSLKVELETMEKVKKEWPIKETEYQEVSAAKNRLALAENHSLYTSILEAETEYKKSLEVLSGLKEIDKAKVDEASRLERRIASLKNKLAGLNLIAKIRTYGDSTVEFIPVSTGEAKTIEDGEIKVKEAATIRVPGVIDIQLVPEGIDPDAIKSELTELIKNFQDILVTYEVQNVSDLDDKYRKYFNADSQLKLSKTKYENEIKGLDLESIKAIESKVPEDIENPSELKKRHMQKYGRSSMDQILGRLESELRIYSDKYVSKEELQKSIDAKEKEFSGKLKDQSEAAEIPSEYMLIKNSEEHDRKLENEVIQIEKKLEAKREEVLDANRALGEKSAEEYDEEYQIWKDEFEARKAEYLHWRHIKSVFDKVKESAKGNPVEDIEKKFKEYLDVLSEGRLAVASIDEKISVKLTSGKHAMTYDILSEGTKDTISLAFRLAMLEHLFPEGNGMAVFDDPFTDMDPKRTKQACALIQKFAEKNQVIFITCDDKYKEMLKGQYIPM